MKKVNNIIAGLLIILVVSFLLRIIRIDYPKTFVFDEVYYAFTAQEYLKGNSDAWVWWGTASEGWAFAWVNPPLPQEIMALSMFIFNTKDSWAWRLPGVIFGVLAIYLVFEIPKLLFKNESVALLSAFVFSIDGLNFVQSKVAMLDIYLVTFILSSFYFLLKKNWIPSAVFLGFAISSKWTAIYLLLLLAVILIKNGQFKQILYFIIFPPLIYLLIYLPFFLTNHTIPQFIELIKQEFWYHTNLKATHDFASSWWSWPLNLYPVWYFVDYQKDKIANIFASGNPLVFWGGTLAIVLSIIDIVRSRFNRERTDLNNLPIILAGFFIFWLPWVLSNRIMFLYYFSPAVPFMSITLGYQLNKLNTKQNIKLLFVILGAIVISFALVYPFLTGIPIPKEWVKVFFLTNLAKNPF